jgi:hypothetical protein
MPLRRLLIAGLAAFAAAPAADGQTPDEPSPHARCERHADALLGALDDARYDAAVADFDEALRARYPSDTLKHDFEALPSTYGKMLGRGRPHSAEINDRTVVMTPLIFEHGLLTVEVHCGAEGRISDLKLLPTQTMGAP